MDQFSTSILPTLSSENQFSNSEPSNASFPYVASEDYREKSIISGQTSLSGTNLSKLQESDGYIMGIIESRGKVSQIGIAAFSLSSTSLFLYQFTDCSSYNSTLSILANKPPDALVLNNASLNSTFSSRLYEIIRKEYSEVLVFLVPRGDFNYTQGHQRLKALTTSKSEKILNTESESKEYSLAAANALMKFLEQQVVIKPHSLSVHFEASEDRIQLDFHTIKYLELVKSLDSNWPKSSLFSAVDRTSTPMGKKELRNRLLQPYSDINSIIRTQEAIEFMCKESQIGLISEKLKEICNFDQIVSSLVCARRLLNIDAFEAKIMRIFQIQSSFKAIQEILHLIDYENGGPSLISRIKDSLSVEFITELLEKIDQVINDDIQVGAKGSLTQHKKCFAIKEGIDSLLDTSRRAFSEISNDVYEYVEALSSNLHDLLFI